MSVAVHRRRDGENKNACSPGRDAMARMLSVVFGMLALVFLAQEANAQFYKGKTITMIVNYPAGGPTDLEGRIVAQHLP